MDEPSAKGSAHHKRTKFKRTGGSKNANSWSSSAGSGSASNTPKSLSQQSSMVATLLADIVSEILIEDERPILPGVPVRAATLSALVRLCVHSFGETCYFNCSTVICTRNEETHATFISWVEDPIG